MTPSKTLPDTNEIQFQSSGSMPTNISFRTFDGKTLNTVKCESGSKLRESYTDQHDENVQCSMCFLSSQDNIQCL